MGWGGIKFNWIIKFGSSSSQWQHRTQRKKKRERETETLKTWSGNVTSYCTFGSELSVSRWASKAEQLENILWQCRCSPGLTRAVSSQCWNENSLRSIISFLPQERGLPTRCQGKHASEPMTQALEALRSGTVPCKSRRPRWRHEAL